MMQLLSVLFCLVFLFSVYLVSCYPKLFSRFKKKMDLSIVFVDTWLGA